MLFKFCSIFCSIWPWAVWIISIFYFLTCKKGPHRVALRDKQDHTLKGLRQFLAHGRGSLNIIRCFVHCEIRGWNPIFGKDPSLSRSKGVLAGQWYPVGAGRVRSSCQRNRKHETFVKGDVSWLLEKGNRRSRYWRRCTQVSGGSAWWSSHHLENGWVWHQDGEPWEMNLRKNKWGSPTPK